MIVVVVVVELAVNIEKNAVVFVLIRGRFLERLKFATRTCQCF
jgi:hypothetical protein